MISHVALLARRHRHSGQLPLWFLVAKGMILLFMLYTVTVFGLMSIHFQSKAHDLNDRWTTKLQQSGVRNDCELDRLSKAENAAWDDALTFNVFRMMMHWNTNYLAKQPTCGR